MTDRNELSIDGPGELFNAGMTTATDLFDTGWNLDTAQLTVGVIEPALQEAQRVETAEEQREDEGGAPIDRLHWFLDPREYPGDAIPENAVLDAFIQSIQLQQAEPFVLHSLQMLASPSQWQLIGPGNFSGRVNAVAVDRNNTQRIYVCTSSGGVWRSTNGGNSWTDINSGLGSNFTSAIVIDPSNSNVVYMSTGDHNIRLPGAGLYRSINMGNSWTLTGLANIRWASRITVHLTNANVVERTLNS